MTSDEIERKRERDEEQDRRDLKLLRRMTFAVVLACMSVIGVGYNMAAPGVISWGYPIASWGGLFLIYAVFQSRERALLKAAAMVQALGILLLILGMVGMGSVLLSSNGEFKASAEFLRPILIPFIEGLASSAIALMLCTQLGVSAKDDNDSPQGVVTSGVAGISGDIDLVVQRLRGVALNMGELDRISVVVSKLIPLLQQMGVLVENMHKFFPPEEPKPPAPPPTYRS